MIVNYIAHIIKIEDSHIKELINKGKKTPDEKERIFDYIKICQINMNMILI